MFYGEYAQLFLCTIFVSELLFIICGSEINQNQKKYFGLSGSVGFPAIYPKMRSKKAK